MERLNPRPVKTAIPGGGWCRCAAHRSRETRDHAPGTQESASAGILLPIAIAPSCLDFEVRINFLPSPKATLWRGGVFELPDALADRAMLTISTPVDQGYLEVLNAGRHVFTVAMQEIDCGTLY